ncbi:unnamed protein product [Plutella xylostella]|uniref:(diamondback moth) hypothetical protein n=1 Tax=Plutella xylostella TaxID=51655 RepID=A0A8S4G193_PLUXY|nr:unnamed protein product [Plutella xylostella]
MKQSIELCVSVVCLAQLFNATGMTPDGDEQRKLGKNILRVSRTFQKLSACGLFAVQPALLLRLCGVLLTLTLMLLQLVLL